MMTKFKAIFLTLFKILRLSHLVAPNPREKGTTQSADHSINNNALQKCYFCKGAGLVPSNSFSSGRSVGQRIGGKGAYSGDWEKTNNRTCPVCKGAGYIQP